MQTALYLCMLKNLFQRKQRVTCCIGILTAILLVLPAASQTNAYRESLKKGLQVLDSSQGLVALNKAAVLFADAVKADGRKWLGYYYEGLCDVLIAFGKKGKEIDTWCDKAEKLAAHADSLSGNNSEIYVLKSMCASARINANVIGRGQKYGGLASGYAEQALKLNAHNPRAYLQKAMTVYHTPEVFGGGAKRSKPLFEAALAEFEAARPASPADPHWGKEQAQQYLKKLSKQ